MQPLYLGVDGGATKCIVRLEDEAGHVLGQGVGGSANIRLSVEQTWHSILQALTAALAPLQLTVSEATPHLRVGMGLAGCEIQAALSQFLKNSPPFQALKVTSDAHAACLGAHGGGEGAILIAGTGVVGYHIQAGCNSQVSGWGFPHDDQGGGAWLGLKAVQWTLQGLDGRAPMSGLATAIAAQFDHSFTRLVDWANQATSSDFATLAPLVIREANARDAVSLACLHEAANHLNKVSEALVKKQTPGSTPLPLALIGSIAMHLAPFLDEPTKARLVQGKLPPEAGAILLVRNAV